MVTTHASERFSDDAGEDGWSQKGAYTFLVTTKKRERAAWLGPSCQL